MTWFFLLDVVIFASIFVGRIDNAGLDGMATVRQSSPDA
jgi:transaldolase